MYRKRLNTISDIARFIRWRDWGPGKMTVLWSLCLYIAVAMELPFDRFAITFIVFMAFAATQSALGYVLNDWGDRDLDRRQFKNNAFNGKSPLESTLALTLLLVMALVTGLPLVLRPGFGLLWCAWIAAAAAYSLEPFRLKTKGLVGLVVSAAAQWFLPVLITFGAFEAGGGLDMWILAMALTVTGVTLEIGHQRYDRSRDLVTRAETFAALVSNRKIDRIYASALLLDKLTIGLIIAVNVFLLVSLQTRWTVALAFLLGCVYVLLVLVTLGKSLQALGGSKVDDPYYGNHSQRFTAVRLLHEILLNFGLPVVLGIAATVHSPLYAIVLGLFLIWRIVLGGADLRWPLRSLKTRL